MSYIIKGDLKLGVACHCSQCRKQSGHFWASTDVSEDRIVIDGADNLTWHHASEKIRRGFCKTCGSFLFWNPTHQPRIAVALGTFDSPTNTAVSHHIFVSDKGDYYAIADGLPQEG